MHGCLRLLWFQELTGLFTHGSGAVTPSKLLGAKLHKAGCHGVEESVVHRQMLRLMVAVLLMRVRVMKMRMRMMCIGGVGSSRGRKAVQWWQA